MGRKKKVVEEVVLGASEVTTEPVVATEVVAPAEEPKKREFLGTLGTQLVVRIRPILVGPHQIPMNQVLTAEGVTYQLSDRDLEAQLKK
jgi:hypothetical protein